VGASRDGTALRDTAATVLRGVALAGALAAVTEQSDELRMLRAQPLLPGGVTGARLISAAQHAMSTLDTRAWDPAAESIRAALRPRRPGAARGVGEAMRDLVGLDDRHLLDGEAQRTELTDFGFAGLDGAQLGPAERATVRRGAALYQRVALHDARAAVPLLWLETNAVDPALDACAEARERMAVHLRFDHSGARGATPEDLWRPAVRAHADRGRVAALRCPDASAVLARPLRARSTTPAPPHPTPSPSPAARRSRPTRRAAARAATTDSGLALDDEREREIDLFSRARPERATKT